MENFDPMSISRISDEVFPERVDYLRDSVDEYIQYYDREKREPMTINQ